MSCHWDIKCLDCDEVDDLGETNHAVDEIRALVRHADAIAGLAELEGDLMWFEMKFGLHRNIHPSWFAKHKGHKLAPFSEYGEIDGKCGERFRCKECTTWYTCNLDKNHQGDHRP